MPAGEGSGTPCPLSSRYAGQAHAAIREPSRPTTLARRRRSRARATSPWSTRRGGSDVTLRLPRLHGGGSARTQPAAVVVGQPPADGAVSLRRAENRPASGRGQHSVSDRSLSRNSVEGTEPREQVGLLACALLACALLACALLACALLATGGLTTRRGRYRARSELVPLDPDDRLP